MGLIPIVIGVGVVVEGRAVIALLLERRTDGKKQILITGFVHAFSAAHGNDPQQIGEFA